VTVPIKITTYFLLLCIFINNELFCIFINSELYSRQNKNVRTKYCWPFYLHKYCNLDINYKGAAVKWPVILKPFYHFGSSPALPLPCGFFAMLISWPTDVFTKNYMLWGKVIRLDVSKYSPDKDKSHLSYLGSELRTSEPVDDVQNFCWRFDSWKNKHKIKRKC
jgi:hypothetical protein